MADYLRTGTSIGIIGGNALSLMLSIQAKMMGFNVYILDSDTNCPASVVADELIQEDYHDISAIERLGRMCDVVTYAVSDLDVDALSLLEKRIYLPQTADLLALMQDKLLLKGFLEECGVNVVPYATIVQMTDIEEKIDGIGYPCKLEATRSNKEIYLTGPSDMFETLEMVKEGACILEATIGDVRNLSLTVAQNEEGEITTFPVVEHIYNGERLVQTVAAKDYLDKELTEEIKRIGRIIASKLGNRGAITIDLLLTEAGIIFVDKIIPIIDMKAIYTKDACAIDAFEAHLRSICNWPLLKDLSIDTNIIVYHIIARELSFMQRQIQHQPEWKFYFYNKDATLLSANVGHISVITEDVDNDLAKLNSLMK